MNLFEQWQFGYMAIITPSIFVAIYLLGRQLRKFAGWAYREQEPKERAGVFVVLFTAIGVFLGGFLQKPADLGVDCYKADQKIISCLFSKIYRSPS